MEGHISGVKVGMGEKKRNTVVTIYGNNTAPESFAKIKDLSLMMQLMGTLKEEESMKK